MMEQDYKDTFMQELMVPERPGMENLIKHMEDNGFFTSPCSGQYHLCQEGGLLKHSVNVLFQAVKLYKSFELQESMPIGSVIIAALLHDLGKMGQFGKPNYTPNMISDGKGWLKQSEKKPFEVNKDLIPVPHEIRSIQIASQFIELTEEENFAILHHNGLYGDLKYQLQGKERPLQMLIHWADMWASHVIEMEGK